VVQVWRKSIWVDGFDDFVSLLLMEGSSQGRAGFYILLMGVSLKMALATLAFLILRDLSLFYLLHLPFRHLIYFTRADEQNLKVFYTADFGHLQATQFKWDGLEVSQVTWQISPDSLRLPFGVLFLSKCFEDLLIGSPSKQSVLLRLCWVLTTELYGLKRSHNRPTPPFVRSGLAMIMVTDVKVHDIQSALH
jgi:hypothetical protein